MRVCVRAYVRASIRACDMCVKYSRLQLNRSCTRQSRIRISPYTHYKKYCQKNTDARKRL